MSAASQLGAWPLYAQTSQNAAPASARRPFRGIFGGAASPDSPHSLILSASLFAAYDDNVLEAITNRRVRRPWLQESGVYEGAQAGLNYSFDASGQRASFRGRVGGYVNYYHKGSTGKTLPRSQGSVSFDFRLTKSLTFAAHQSAAFSSNYNSGLTPDPDEEIGNDIGALQDPELDLFGMRSMRAATTLSLSQRFGRGTSVSARYYLRRVEVFDEEPDSRFHDYQTQAGSAGFRHTRHLTRNAELELGYGIRVSDRRSHTGEPRVMHNVIAGVNYGRALSFSRRTSLSFGSGSAITTSDNLTAEGSDPRTRARLIGHATITHELGRTWTAQAGYTRGLRARDGFDALYYTDGIRVGLNGLLSRRIALAAAAQWATSSLDLPGRTTHWGTSATAQASYALAGFAAVYAQYVYYRYRYGEDIVLDDRLPRRLDRQGVRVGITTSVPLIR